MVNFFKMRLQLSDLIKAFHRTGILYFNDNLPPLVV